MIKKIIQIILISIFISIIFSFFILKNSYTKYFTSIISREFKKENIFLSFNNPKPKFIGIHDYNIKIGALINKLFLEFKIDEITLKSSASLNPKIKIYAKAYNGDLFLESENIKTKDNKIDFNISKINLSSYLFGIPSGELNSKGTVVLKENNLKEGSGKLIISDVNKEKTNFIKFNLANLKIPEFSNGNLEVNYEIENNKIFFNNMNFITTEGEIKASGYIKTSNLNKVEYSEFDFIFTNLNEEFRELLAPIRVIYSKNKVSSDDKNFKFKFKSDEKNFNIEFYR